MTNKVIRQASKCANSVVVKSRFSKQNSNKNANKNVIRARLILNYLYIKHKSLQSVKTTKNVNSKLLKTKDERTMLLLKCVVCNNKKSRFMKVPEA